jgi:D-alanine transaminase
MIVYFNGRFMPKDEVSVSPDDRGFLFGDGAYEVLSSYRGRLFRAADHFARLHYSLQQLRIDPPGEQVLANLCRGLIQANQLQEVDATLYIEVTRGAAPRQHAFPDQPVPPTVYATASPRHPPEEKWQHGIRVILVPDIRWARCDIKSVALVASVLASQQASVSGAGEAVFVRDGVVTEGSHTSFCAVFASELVTHPRTNHILAGITRAVVLDLCRELGIPCREVPVCADELPSADELMVLGTTSEVMPVVAVDEWTVADGRPGPVTRKLQRAYRELTRSDSS